MKRLLCAIAILALLFQAAVQASAQARAESSNKRGPGTVGPAATGGAVSGSGTPGRLSKWTGVTGSSTFTLGDSLISEDKFGKVGIGTDTPASPLTVQGMIETTLGGYKFPDGTVQSTAALTLIFHNATLTGSGTAASPIGIADAAVTAPKIAGGTVVRSLNGIFDNLTLVGGNNITITHSANSLTIAASNSLAAVSHDLTLTGDGSTGSPLGIAIPLFLDGSVSGFASHVLTARNTDAGNGVFAGGGPGGTGLDARGGDGFTGGGGLGLSARGGDSREATPGDGLTATGGNSGIGFGGVGIRATGGDSNETIGGVGLRAQGGTSGSKFGGIGVNAIGGVGTGAGHAGGAALFAQGGQGQLGAAIGPAGEFNGNVEINGNLSKSGGSFKIDHPLDPANKYLYHSFVESPDMKNIYDGTVTTDANGDATITLPDWFQALNRDFRYQLTVIGTFAQAIVADEIKDNRFAIKTSAANVKVSWQVTGIRQDAYANSHRIRVEEDKPGPERGTYLHPDLFAQPEEKSVEWARHPEAMRQMKANSEKAVQGNQR